MKNKDNFYLNTFARFFSVGLGSVPSRPCDYVSASGSMYWYENDGVYRLSDHWGHVASCYWPIIGGRAIVGFCKWANFKDATPEEIHNYAESLKSEKEKRADLWLSKITKKEKSILEACEERAEVREVSLSYAYCRILETVSDVPLKALNGSTVIYSECVYSDFPKAYKYSPKGTVCTFIFKSGRPVLVDAVRSCTYKRISWDFTETAKAAIVERRNR